MKVFLDNNLSPALARGLAHLRRPFNEEVVHLRDRYLDQSISDETWLEDLATEGGWIVLSIDRFKKNSAEREAIRDPNLTVFMFTQGFAKQKRWMKTQVVIRRWEEIIETAKGRGRGKCFTVRMHGKISQCD